MQYTKITQQLGSHGGKKSVKVRFANKTKKEISETMRKVRLSKKDVAELTEIIKEETKTF